MAELLAIGVSHKTAPLELRERAALTEGRAAGVLSELVAKSARAKVSRLRRALDASSPAASRSRVAPSVPSTATSSS